MIYFRSDYSQGAHPEVMEALMRTNLEHHDGYALDEHSEHAAELVKELIGCEDCSVYMMIGGTNCNVTTIAAALRPYEGVITPRTGHAYFHEAGAVEGTGHRVLTLTPENGKLTPEILARAWDEFEDDHTPLPRMVYISEPTESGSLYTKAELEAVSAYCRENDLLLYIDGARLGSALTCDACDFSIKDIPPLCDAFYIGGTKNGALMGEALVILNKDIDDHFRWMIKRQCGMLAKGRLIGVQFEALLEGGEDGLYYRLARETNRLAAKLRDGLTELGCEFYGTSETNQIFPILPTPVVEALEEDFFFYRWAPEENGRIPVRFVLGWGSTDADVDALLARIKELL